MYEKKLAGGSYYWARLDCALATPEWSMRFPLAEVRHLTTAAFTTALLCWNGSVCRRADDASADSIMRQCGSGMMTFPICLQQYGSRRGW